MPEIAGVYNTKKVRKLGKDGATTRDFTQVISWFVIRLDDDRYLTMPLNDEHLPSGITSVVDAADFVREYSPDPGFYTEHILPLVTSLRERIGDGSLPFDPETLDVREQRLFASLQIDGFLETAPDGVYGTSLALLRESAADREGFAVAAASRINSEGVQLRKNRDFERSLEFYAKALELRPEDDHLFFNLARVHYEKGDVPQCLELLDRALKLNPELEAARKMKRFIGGKIAGKEGPNP